MKKALPNQTLTVGLMNKLRLIVDTNVFMVSLAPQYKYRWIYDCLIQDKFELAYPYLPLLTRILNNSTKVYSFRKLLTGLMVHHKILNSLLTTLCVFPYYSRLVGSNRITRSRSASRLDR